MIAGIEDALADVAAMGPFFTVSTDPDLTGLRPLTELYDGALPEMIADVRERLGDAEPRVAASLLFQGVAGRLWSPVLATAAVHGMVPDLDPARTYWQAASPGPILLTAPRNTAPPATRDAARHPRTAENPPPADTPGIVRDAAEGPWPAEPSEAVRGHAGKPGPAEQAGVVRAEVWRVVVEGNLWPLVAAVRAAVRVAEGLLWGNAASALAGALGVLARARPRHAAAARRLVDELLAAPPLRGTGAFGPQGFRRRSCCLYYRVPGGGLCGDCALL
jgi:hypothetical protein